MSKLTGELYDLKLKVAEMSTLVDKMYAAAIKALITHDIELAAEVISSDKIVDKLDIDIDNHCLRILALFSPKAMELRFIIASLKIIMDLERAGDHAKIIARQVKKHHCAALIGKLDKFDELYKESALMYTLSVEAFFKIDDKLNEMLDAEKRINKLQKQLNNDLIGLLTQENGTVVIALVNIVKRMERVADHAKNIARLVPYIKKGEQVRHKGI